MPKIRKSAKKFVNPPENPTEHIDPLVQKVAEAHAQVIEITDEDLIPDEPRLEAAEMKELQLLNFALRAYAAERELATLKRDEFLKLIDPSNQLRNFAGLIQGLTSEHNASMQSMNRLVESIKTRLGVDLKKHTYNEETGILTRIEE